MRDIPSARSIPESAALAATLVDLVTARQSLTGQVTARIARGATSLRVGLLTGRQSHLHHGVGEQHAAGDDVRSRAIIARPRPGANPSLAHVTPDGKTVLVVNRRDGTLGIHDAATLMQRGSVFRRRAAGGRCRLARQFAGVRAEPFVSDASPCGLAARRFWSSPSRAGWCAHRHAL